MEIIQSDDRFFGDWPPHLWNKEPLSSWQWSRCILHYFVKSWNVGNFYGFFVSTLHKTHIFHENFQLECYFAGRPIFGGYDSFREGNTVFVLKTNRAHDCDSILRFFHDKNIVLLLEKDRKGNNPIQLRIATLFCFGMVSVNNFRRRKQATLASHVAEQARLHEMTNLGTSWNG